jgi:hypothetical protein
MKIKKLVVKLIKFIPVRKTIKVSTRGINFEVEINFIEFIYLNKIKKSLNYYNVVLYTDFEKSLLDFYDIVNKFGLRVAVLGGGEGISAIYCSINYSPKKLMIIESSDIQCGRISTNLKNNFVHDVEVIHATVGDKLGVYKNRILGEYIDINSLEDYDFIEMDIEASEHSLLKSLQIRPQYLSVEFHPYDIVDYSYLYTLEPIYRIIRLTSETHKEISSSTEKIIEELEANKIVHALFSRI